MLPQSGEMECVSEVLEGLVTVNPTTLQQKHMTASTGAIYSISAAAPHWGTFQRNIHISIETYDTPTDSISTPHSNTRVSI